MFQQAKAIMLTINQHDVDASSTWKSWSFSSCRTRLEPKCRTWTSHELKRRTVRFFQHGKLGLPGLVARGSSPSPSVARRGRTNPSVARLGFSNMESQVSQRLSHEAQAKVSHVDVARTQVSHGWVFPTWKAWSLRACCTKIKPKPKCRTVRYRLGESMLGSRFVQRGKGLEEILSFLLKNI